MSEQAEQPLQLSETAAMQIKQSAEQSGMQDTALRFAVEKLPDGKLRYAMGFDDLDNSDDIEYQSQDIKIIISKQSVALLQGTTLDFVELDTGENQFVFLNPNDPDYKPAG